MVDNDSGLRPGRRPPGFLQPVGSTAGAPFSTTIVPVAVDEAVSTATALGRKRRRVERGSGRRSRRSGV